MQGWQTHRACENRARHVFEDGRDYLLPGTGIQQSKGAGFKANYYDVATRDEYWISGPRKDGRDALYATNVATEIDEDVADEYWTQIRKRRKVSN